MNKLLIQNNCVEIKATMLGNMLESNGKSYAKHVDWNLNHDSSLF